MSNDLTEFKESISKEAFRISKAEALEQEICIECKEKALPNCYSTAGRREYYISGLCEKCFDKIFA